MADITEDMLYEGVAVDIAFAPPGPRFGDLFQICGCDHPNFESSGAYGFDKLADLQFSQVDDYFGIKSLTDNGDDVVVWLFPLVDGKPVHHHEGPFDAIRLQFNVLRNPPRHVESYTASRLSRLSGPVYHVISQASVLTSMRLPNTGGRMALRLELRKHSKSTIDGTDTAESIVGLRRPHENAPDVLKKDRVFGTKRPLQWRARNSVQIESSTGMCPFIVENDLTPECYHGHTVEEVARKVVEWRKL